MLRMIGQSSLKLFQRRLMAVISHNPVESCVGRRLSNVGETEMTSIRYPHIKRGTHYSRINDRDVSFFQRLLKGRVLTQQEDIEPYNVDWLKAVRGASPLVLRPKTTEEVSEILKYCNLQKLAVCPQGGNTGLVGGSVPVFDEIVLSMQLMNNIIKLDEVSGILICQSGCVLETLDEYLADYDLMMPLDLGAKGSCQIGGNVSTNAGGLRLLRYGSLHGSVLGLEAVLANGEVLDSLSTNRKDNTGYDLKQLFIGSEGSLGVVTKVSILCPQKPKAVNLAFLGLDSYSHVLATLREAKKDLGEILSAFEFIDEDCMRSVEENLGLTNPLSHCPFYCLIETSGSNEQHDEEKLNAFLEKNMDNQTIMDGTIATDASKIKHLWQFRERVAESMLGDGYTFKYDVSLPVDLFQSLVDVVRKRTEGHYKRIVGYGHVGDGNIHLNVTIPKYDKEVAKIIEPFVYQWVSENRGSISAEHGLGFHKRNYIGYSKSAAAVTLMLQLKALMDPNHILNPYKTLP